MRTDWSKRAKPAEYLNMKEDGAHSPGPDADVVPWLIKERDVHGFGTESVGTDAGQAQHLDPPYPCHYYMHGNNRYGLQCLTNLDQLPPTGAVIFSAPLKIRSGSGSPCASWPWWHDPPRSAYGASPPGRRCGPAKLAPRAPLAAFKTE